MRGSPNAPALARYAASDTLRNRVVPPKVRAATYTTVGTGLRYLPAYSLAYSGTAGSSIVSQPVGVVTPTYSSVTGPMIRAYHRNHISRRGFTLHEANAHSPADTSIGVVWITTGSSIEDCVLNGNGNARYGDTHPGIRLEYAGSVTIRNNSVPNFQSPVVALLCQIIHSHSDAIAAAGSDHF